MKLAWNRIEAFVENPDPDVRAVLLYGADNGLMKERSDKLGLRVVDDLNDPFNVSVLSADILADDPARFMDEANAISLMGGGKLIRVEKARDKISGVLKEYLENPNEQNLVVVEAGELSPKSSLRKLFEASKVAVTLPCYVEDERGVAEIVRKMLRDEGFSISYDALQVLASSVVGDRARVRREVEKLVVYMQSGGREISIDDVVECCVDAGVKSIDDFVYAVASGRASDALGIYSKLLADGVPVIAILRSLQKHFDRLHFVVSAIDGGRSVDEAMGLLHPPVFFKLKSMFKGQLRRWNLKKLSFVLMKLMELEAQSKRSGYPVETLCAQAVLSISSMR